MELKLSKSVMIDLVFYSFCYDLVFNYFLRDFCQAMCSKFGCNFFFFFACSILD